MKRFLLLTSLSLVFAHPSFAGVTVVGGLTRERIVAPGDDVEGIIHLKNGGNEDVTVKIFQADYRFTADGATLYTEPGSVPRSNAAWISPTPPRITVPAGELASVYYAIDVPNRQDLTGTYWSVLMIEPVSDSGAQNVKGQAGEVVLGVQTIVRYAVQTITTVGESGESNIRFMEKRLVRENGRTLLLTDIENVGERSLTPSVWAELYNEDGLSIGRFESERLRIFPTCSVRHCLDLTDVPRGFYKALLIVDNGDEHVFGANYDLQIK